MYKIIQIDFELFYKKNMFFIKHVRVHWVNLMKKNHIKISKAWNFEPNGCKGKKTIIQIF
jgi:hypothetical protein